LILKTDFVVEFAVPAAWNGNHGYIESLGDIILVVFLHDGENGHWMGTFFELATCLSYFDPQVEEVGQESVVVALGVLVCMCDIVVESWLEDGVGHVAALESLLDCGVFLVLELPSAGGGAGYLFEIADLAQFADGDVQQHHYDEERADCGGDRGVDSAVVVESSTQAQF